MKVIILVFIAGVFAYLSCQLLFMIRFWDDNHKRHAILLFDYSFFRNTIIVVMICLLILALCFWKLLSDNVFKWDETLPIIICFLPLMTSFASTVMNRRMYAYSEEKLYFKRKYMNISEISLASIQKHFGKVKIVLNNEAKFWGQMTPIQILTTEQKAEEFERFVVASQQENGR